MVASVLLPLLGGLALVGWLGLDVAPVQQVEAAVGQYQLLSLFIELFYKGRKLR